MGVVLASLGQLRPDFDPLNVPRPEIPRSPTLKGFGLVIANMQISLELAVDYGANGIAVSTAPLMASLAGVITPVPDTILAVAVVDVTAIDQTTRRPFRGVYDRLFGTVRLFKGTAGADVEITSADLTDGDIVWAVVLFQVPNWGA